MPHPSNPKPDPVLTLLHQYAVHHGVDYVTALVAAHQTAKEVLEYNATELAERTLQRCTA
jgi:hypothetical protein